MGGRVGAWVVWATIACGCSSGDFTVAGTSDGATDAATEETSARDATTDAGGDTTTNPVDGGSDTGRDGAVVPTDAPSSDGGCTLVDETHVYVKAGAAEGGTGAEACPFRTIGEALAKVGTPSSKRTIHVLGGSYFVTEALKVPPKTAIIGAGPSVVTVGGGGSCTALDGCVFVLNDDASITGMRIEAKARVGVLFSVTPGKTGAASNLVVIGNGPPSGPPSGTSGNAAGVLVTGGGSVELGPSLRSTKAVGAALRVVDATSVRVVAGTGGASANAFNESRVGIELALATSGVLTFEGGETLLNVDAGVVLASAGPHSIRGLTAQDNRFGIVTEPAAGLVLRSSTLLRNKRTGVWIKGGSSAAKPPIDLGTAADPGRNWLQRPPTGPTSGDRNPIDGVCFDAAFPDQISARGNYWGFCAGDGRANVAGLTSGASCETQASYADVHNRVASYTGGVLDTGDCKTGP